MSDFKKSVEYIAELSVGEAKIKLSESGKWNFNMVTDGLTKKDLAMFRNLLEELINEQELAR